MEESINSLEAHLQQLAIPVRDEEPFHEAYERTRQGLSTLLRAIEEKVSDREDLRGQLREHAALLFQPLRLFVAGEFSKGKSYLINVLCGNKTVRETNIGPQDTKITVLAHGDARDNTSSRYVDIKHYPFPFLKLINLVDSPGINAVLRPEHTKITQEHVASADLILFVTSAERTVSQEEIDLIRFIAEHNKSEVVFIINKIDVFEDSLIDFVDHEGMTTLIRFLEQVLARETHIRDPLVFSLSTRRAMWAMMHRNAQVWERSGIGTLINHIGQILQSGEAALLKLRSPLNYLNGEHIDGLPILQGLSQRVDRLTTELEQSRATTARVEEDIRHQINEIHEAIDEFKFDEIERAFEGSLDLFLERFLSKESLHAFKSMTKEDQVKYVQRELNDTFAPWEQGVDAKKLTYIENILRRFERCWAHSKQTLQAEAKGPLYTLIEDRERREGKTLEEAFDFER
jgi:tRNA U34 5-carboxymethylaminomethyl modifying GTPase MnmE/TrmE